MGRWMTEKVQTKAVQVDSEANPEVQVHPEVDPEGGAEDPEVEHVITMTDQLVIKTTVSPIAVSPMAVSPMAVIPAAVP